MSLYFIGDLQGCHEPLQRLLQKIDFSASRDTLYVLGDMVNRGPESLAVLRQLAGLGDAARSLLGNHDLHLLAHWAGVRRPHSRDTVQEILDAPDCPSLMDWLRHRSMALHEHGWLMVHAGVLPQWTAAKTMALAHEVEQTLRGPGLNDFLAEMYGNTPRHWDDALTGNDRLRVVVNALTRLRFCTPDGVMEFAATEGADAAPSGYLPWFEVPGRQTADTLVAFGHWSTLSTDAGYARPRLRSHALGLDTGCVWGGCLTAARLGAAAGTFELFSVDCVALKNPKLARTVSS